MQAAIRAIEYHLPSTALSTSDLAAEFPEWPVEKIDRKTGISERHIAAAGECASDLGCAAAAKLFESGAVSPAGVDALLLCTQSPDYFLPTTACLLQDRLGLPTACFALDFNQGCSGFVYGLGIAKGLIETGQARSVLLVTAETYTKFIHPRDKSVRTIFGDAAAATLIEGVSAPSGAPLIGPFVFGTDGSGARHLIVSSGGMRHPLPEAHSADSGDGASRAGNYLYMDGAEVFDFALRVVPDAFAKILDAAGMKVEDVDLFVFHQANQYMLQSLRLALNLPEQKFVIAMRHCGNTVSSTIPIALKHAAMDARLGHGNVVMLVGFGVGYSWGATLIRWCDRWS
ncbi:MAG: ketoacyl-ACP synthase III [Bryobacterales bacterium]|nr:ketoacyl-ACP synthase III [Bryobacterales bacterium]